MKFRTVRKRVLAFAKRRVSDRIPKSEAGRELEIKMSAAGARDFEKHVKELFKIALRKCDSAYIQNHRCPLRLPEVITDNEPTIESVPE